jgi:ubiquinone/menaquinone biosynthesis C-methylase UbiE
VGYLLINPIRRLLENPDKILRPFVTEGMTVLEPGCGMGYFTLPLADMVGPRGRVIAVDLQDKMLAALSRRAERKGLLMRIEVRKASIDSLSLADLTDRVDFAVAFHVVHEVQEENSFFSEIFNVLRGGGGLFVVEPRFHVTRQAFDRSVAAAKDAGFAVGASRTTWGSREILLRKYSLTP